MPGFLTGKKCKTTEFALCEVYGAYSHREFHLDPDGLLNTI